MSASSGCSTPLLRMCAMASSYRSPWSSLRCRMCEARFKTEDRRRHHRWILIAACMVVSRVAWVRTPRLHRREHGDLGGVAAAGRMLDQQPALDRREEHRGDRGVRWEPQPGAQRATRQRRGTTEAREQCCVGNMVHVCRRVGMFIHHVNTLCTRVCFDGR